MSAEHDDLRHRLAKLEDALGDTHLPGPTDARHRARQRSRRQATGAALGAVAAVAVGAMIVGGLPSLSSAPVPPADAPTEEPTTEPPAGDSLLLTVDDLEANSGADELVGWTGSDAPEAPSISCAPSADDDADLVVRRSFATPDDGRLDQFVEIRTAERAQTRFDDITREVVACVEEWNTENPDDNWMNVIWTVDGIGDETWQADYAIQPRVGDQLTIVTVTVIRAGDAITVLTQAGLGFHGHQEGPLPYDLAAAAATKLCASAGSACVGDPAPHRVYPALESGEGEPGWLTVDDIVTGAPFFAGIATAGEVMAGEGIHSCFGDPLAVGGQSFQVRTYSDPLDTSLEFVVFQYLARFGSNAQAEAYYAGLPNTNADCAVEVTGEVGGAGYAGTVWRSSDEFAAFHLGAVFNGSAVSLIVADEPSWAPESIPPSQLEALLARAGERLAEIE
ncbi:MAG TPA: hypothetical protein VK925_10370 [Jiangellaceae bacterium]|nr:hypothetical protein [Jiangellaceae bacterium]